MIKDLLKSVLWHDGIGVEQEHPLPFGLPEGHIIGGTKSYVLIQRNQLYFWVRMKNPIR